MKNRFLNIALLFLLITVSKSTFAWNVTASSTNAGNASSPNICRNIQQNGSLTASVWFYHALPTPKASIRLVEVDDNGNISQQKLFQLNYSGLFSPTKRIEIHRLLLNQDSNSYILLGTAHNPNTGSPTTQSFLLKIDNFLNISGFKFLDQHFNYYDFTITPKTAKIICVGTLGIFNRLKVPSRKAVITVLDQTFNCMGLNVMPESLPGAGNIPRFDNIKVIKSYFNSITNEEKILIAGHITRDSTVTSVITNYIPEVFVSSIIINASSSITNQWYSVLDSYINSHATICQVVPCDLLYDENRNTIALLSSSTALNSGNFLTSHITLFNSITGNSTKYALYEGQTSLSSPNPSTHTVYGQSIYLKNDGKYCINGWTNNYIISSSVTNRYNFYVVDFDPSSLTFDSMQLVIGTSNLYVGTQPTDFYGLYTDTGYSEGTTFYSLGVYNTAHSMTNYVDSFGNDQHVVIWINTIGINNNSNNRLRIWSSKPGQGDGNNFCTIPKISVSYATDDVLSQLKTINWQYIYCFEFPQGSFDELNMDLDPSLCDGIID
jgi:hypothetical protein